MSKGSETRSGLLWEVQRILEELKELPQVLLMENVPQVHGKKNMADFQEWIDFLNSKGYSNFWKDLNAKNFGVAQNRNRCFMVSILGNYTYEFPEEIPLTKCMKDYLDDVVDEKYYINSDRAKALIEKLILDGTLEGGATHQLDNGESLTQSELQTVFQQGQTGEFQSEGMRETALLNYKRISRVTDCDHIDGS